jgi:hypothetical protein
MGRPKKQPEERRTISLSCRVTAVERLRIETAADHAGLSASEYLRRQALTGRVVVRERRVIDHATFDQLRRIGVNLNQLTRLAHQAGEIPAELSRAAAIVERFIVRALDPEPGPAVPVGGEDEPSSEDGS